MSFAVGGDVSFDRLGVHRGGALVISYGAFLTAVVNVIVIALALFLVVKFYNRFRRQVDSPPTGPTEVELLTEIRDELRKG